MILPSFQALSRNYPTTQNGAAVRQEIGGGVLDSWLGENTCVIRMCKSFNYAGKAYEIPKSGRMHTVPGADGKYYAYKVLEFIEFLTTTYGRPNITSNESKISIDPFKGKTGIIAWHINGWSDARGHFTLWDGSTGLYEGTHDYFRDFRTTRPGRNEQRVPYLTQVQLWKC
jgi:hypothetical protein